MSKMLSQIAKTSVAPELEKIDFVIQQSIPKSVRSVCIQLQKSLREQAELVQDLEDLTTLRLYITNVSFFVTLVLDASPNRSSWWAEPLIHQCYELCGIKDKRDVLIIHARDTILDDFGVYPNILESWAQRLQIDIPSRPLDIFSIPAEVKFDISLIALVGHEVGHIYWHINQDKIRSKVQESFHNLPPPQDLFELDQQINLALMVARHIEEYLCDQIGRFLLGPAFDFALLKLFYSLPDQGSTDSHPPQQSRIYLSRKRLDEYVADTSKNHPCYRPLKVIQSDLPQCKEVTQKYDFDEIAERVAKEIYDSSNLNISERFSEDKIKDRWLAICPELDGFRPPFEQVSTKKPAVITPCDAIIVATLYYYGDTYQESNDFYLDNELPETKKKEILFGKIIDHLRYAISLYDFVRFSHQRLDDFDLWDNKGLLWEWRERKEGGKANAFIVTPTIDCKSEYGQNAVDLRLGSAFLVNVPSRYTHIDPAPGKTPLSTYYQEVHVPVGKEFILHPHQFVLASILEYVCLPYDFYALVLGRSTWGRLGLNIATATTVQAGYRGCLTLELRNLGESPLPLCVGTRVAQLCLIRVAKDNTGQGYYKGAGKYIGPVEVGIPRIHRDQDWQLLNDFSDFISEGYG